VIDADVFAIPLPRLSTGRRAAPSEKSTSAMLDRGSHDFIAGRENRLAGAAVQWLLNRAERSYSPLVLHGPSGSGKSHLALGLAESRENVVATTGADFVREVATAIDQNTLIEFRARYRSAGMFVFDDLTDLVDRRAAQRELINTLDVLELNDVPVVVTSRLPPSEIADLPPALRSRLAGGLQVALTTPGIAARIEILNRLASEREISITPAAVQLLAENVAGAVPELQGAIVKLATAALKGASIGLEEVRRFLADHRTRSQPTLSAIAKAVAKYYGVTPTKLSSASRSRQVSLARSMAIYLGRQLTCHSLQSLGRHFGNRDHSTVLYSYRTLETHLETDAELRSAVNHLRTLLTAA
jgi:chromosomal replication initiator protein